MIQSDNDAAENKTNLYCKRKKIISVVNPPINDTKEYLQAKYSEYGTIANIDLFEAFNTFNALITYADLTTARNVHGVRQDDNMIAFHLGKKDILQNGFFKYCVVGILKDENESENSLYEKFEKYGKIAILLKVAQHVYIRFANNDKNLLLVDNLNIDGHNFYIIDDSRIEVHRQIIKCRLEYILDWDRTVFITNLSTTFDEDDLRTIFFDCGEITHVGQIAIYARDSASSKIVFKNSDSIALAMGKNLTWYKERHIFITTSYDQMIPNYKTSVFVSNIPKNATDEQLYETFSTYGSIRYISRKHCRRNKQDVDLNMAIITFNSGKRGDLLSGNVKIQGYFAKIRISEANGPFFDQNIIRDKEKVPQNGLVPWSHVPDNVVHIGNPPREDTEKILKRTFERFAKIVKVELYNFRGSFNALITFDKPVHENIEKVTMAEEHKISTHLLTKAKKEIIHLDTLAGRLSADDETVTETELFEKFQKYGKVREINKIFPHVYIKFENYWNLDTIIDDCKNDGIDLSRIPLLSEKVHQDIIFDRRICPLRSRGIVVTNLSAHLTKAEVANYFGRLYGKIETIYPMKRYNHDSFRVVIKFVSRPKITNTVLNYRGRRIFIFDLYSIIPNYETSVLVSKLPKNTMEEDLLNHFEQFGLILSIVRHTLEKPNRAIIIFQHKQSADDALLCDTLKISRKVGLVEKYKINVEKSIGLCFETNLEIRTSFFLVNRNKTGEFKNELKNSIQPRSLHIANPPTQDTEAVLSKKFVKYGKIEKIETYTFANTFNAVITFCDPINMDFAKSYRGSWLNNHRICAAPLTLHHSKINDGIEEDERIIQKDTLCGLVNDVNMTENQIYSKFKNYGNLRLALRVGDHIYLNYSPEDDPDFIINKCYADGVILYKIRHDWISKHNLIYIIRMKYLIKKNEIIVTNLHPQMKWSDMCKIFKDCGEIAHFQYNRGDGCEKSFFLTFKNEESVKKAMETVDNTIHEGNRIFIIDTLRKDLPNYNCTVVIKGMKAKVSINTLYDFFSKYGPIEYIFKPSKFIFIAYITFKNEQSAKAATQCITVPYKLSKTGTISVEKSIGLSFEYNMLDSIESVRGKLAIEQSKKASTSNQKKTIDIDPYQQQNMALEKQTKRIEESDFSYEEYESKLTSSYPIDGQNTMHRSIQSNNYPTTQPPQEFKSRVNYSNYNIEQFMAMGQVSKCNTQNPSSKYGNYQVTNNMQCPPVQAPFNLENMNVPPPSINLPNQAIDYPKNSQQTMQNVQGFNYQNYPINNVPDKQIPKETDNQKLSSDRYSPTNINRSRSVSESSQDSNKSEHAGPFTFHPKPIVQPAKPKIQINWPFKLQSLMETQKTVVEPPTPVPAPLQLPVPVPAPVQFPVPVNVVKTNKRTSTIDPTLLKSLIRNTQTFELIEPTCLDSRYPVYISNLSFEATRKEILDIFNEAGRVLQFIFIDSPYSKFMDPPARIAYAYYESLNKCKQTIAKADRRMLHGKRINVVLGRGKYTLSRQRLVRVKNLTVTVTEEMLYEKFTSVGPITRVSKVSPSEGYIFFENSLSKPLALHRAFKPTICGEPIIIYDVMGSTVEFKLERERLLYREVMLIETFNNLKKLDHIDETILMNTDSYVITGCLPVEDPQKMKKIFETHAIHWLIGARITENLGATDVGDDGPPINLEAVQTISDKLPNITDSIEGDVAVFKKEELQRLLDLAFSRGTNAGLEALTKNIGTALKTSELSSKCLPSFTSTRNADNSRVDAQELDNRQINVDNTRAHELDNNRSNSTAKGYNQLFHSFPNEQCVNRSTFESDSYRRDSFDNLNHQSRRNETFIPNRDTFNPNSNKRDSFGNYSNQYGSSNSKFGQNRMYDDDYLPKRSRFSDSNQDFPVNQIWDVSNCNNNSNYGNDPGNGGYFGNSYQRNDGNNYQRNDGNNYQRNEGNFSRNFDNFSRNSNNYASSSNRDRTRKNW